MIERQLLRHEKKSYSGPLMKMASLPLQPPAQMLSKPLDPQSVRTNRPGFCEREVLKSNCLCSVTKK